MTAGSSMLAITRSFPPHCRQVSMSMANTRRPDRRADRAAAAGTRVTGTMERSIGLLFVFLSVAMMTVALRKFGLL